MRIFTCIFFLLTANAFADGCSSLSPQFTCGPLSKLIDVQNISTDYPNLAHVMSQPDRFKLQVIYTQVDRDQHNQPLLHYYHLGLNHQRYFYPASTVKLPIALLAPEWLNQPQQAAITMFSPMLTDTAFIGQTEANVDTTSASGLPSIAHYIKKLLLVSDNDASNRLYELLGQERLNDRLHQLGLKHTLINHRLSLPLTELQNRQYNPIRFLQSNGKEALAIPARESHSVYFNTDKPKIGAGYMAGGELVLKPMDFTNKNRLSLQDLDGIVKRVVFPQLFSNSQQFDITEQQRAFVLRYMGLLPSESDFPAYDGNDYPDNYSKFLLFGGKPTSLPDNIRIFNKTGWAYGHLIDSAYIVDFAHNVEFFVSAVIYTNQNDILNDDQYETEQVGLPFLNELGRFLYEHELKRQKSIAPDLTSIKAVLN